jgi:hypothetical protein
MRKFMRFTSRNSMYLLLIILLTPLQCIASKSNNLTIDQNNTAYLFVNIQDCISCKNQLYSHIISQSKELNIDFNIYIKDLTERQYEKAIQVAQRTFKDSDMKIFVDDKNELSNSLKVANNELIFYDEINRQNRFNLNQKNEIVKLQEFLNSKQISNNKRTKEAKHTRLDFEDYILLNDNEFFLKPNSNQIVFHDKVSQSYIFMNIDDGKFIKEINYSDLIYYYKDRMKYFLDGVEKSQLDDLHEKTRSYFFVKMLFDENDNELFIAHIVQKFSYTADSDGGNFKEQPIYVYAIFDKDFNLLNTIDTRILKYSLRSHPFRIGDNSYLCECFYRDYHHTNHIANRDFAHNLCIFNLNSFEPVGAVFGQLEALTKTVYSYTFLNYFSYDKENNRVFILNPFNSLFASYDIEQFDKSSLKVYEAKGLLKDAFDEYRNLDKFGVYEGTADVSIVSGFTRSFACNNGKCYILLSEYENSRPISYYIQTYDYEGAYMGELEISKLGDLDFANILTISLLGVKDNELIFYKKQKSGEYYITQIPVELIKK